jgi:hypothetical protein
MNNAMLDISVSGVSRFYRVSSIILGIVVTVSSLFLQTVGFLHLKMSAIEQCANIKFCVLKTLQMPEEAYGKMVMKKTQVCKWHKCFSHDYTVHIIL